MLLGKPRHCHRREERQMGFAMKAREGGLACDKARDTMHIWMNWYGLCAGT